MGKPSRWRRKVGILDGLVVPLVFSVAIIGLGLAVWGCCGNKKVDWWAAAGQWFGGVGSAAAAVIALLIARASWEQTKKEKSEREEILPRLIFVKSDPENNKITIFNRSSGDIIQVRIVLPENFLEDGSYFESVKSNCKTVKIENSNVSCNGVTFEVIEKHQRGVASLQSTKPIPDEVTVFFVDPDGIPWKRVGAGPPIKRKLKSLDLGEPIIVTEQT